jgi:hypothetical protein
MIQQFDNTASGTDRVQSTIAGGKLKSIGTKFWNGSNSSATNVSVSVRLSAYFLLKKVFLALRQKDETSLYRKSEAKVCPGL